MTTLTAQPTRLRLTVGLALLAGLLLLRFPFLILFRTILPAPPWVSTLFMDGTYILNALLIFWERDRLEAFHMDGWALGLYILTPLVMMLDSGGLMLSRVQVVCVAALALLLLITRTKLPRARRQTLLWLAISIPVGVAVGLFFGYCIRWQTPLASFARAGSLAQLPMLFLIQFSRAATFEEPLFRGFLWGYLKQAGWKDLWIWLLQAGLFMAGHAYYIAKANISFLLIVPVGALVLGWIAWRSRSIGSSMIVHGFGNSLGDLVGHFRW